MTTKDQMAAMETFATTTPVTVDITMTSSDETKGGTRGAFTLYATVAPENADHYGVIPILDNGDGVRWVLIPRALEQAQLGRYRSGLWPAVLSEDPTTDGIQAELWRRIQKGPR